MNNLTRCNLTTLMTIVLLLFSSVCLAKYPHVTILSETAINVRYSDDNAGKTEWSTGKVDVAYNPTTDVITFKDKNGRILLQTVGDKVRSANSQTFLNADDEYLFGTGQFQDGYLNVRGLTRRLTQVNTQIAIPFILSNKGYGLLWNNDGMTEFNPATNKMSGNEIIVPEDGEYCLFMDCNEKMAHRYYLVVDGKVAVDFRNLWLPPTTSIKMHLAKGNHKIELTSEKCSLYWRKIDNTTTFSSPMGETDFTFFAGKADEVIAEYRHQTGEVPMPPKWAFGYIHCRERYHSQAEILETAREFKKRDIPISVIVQDWQYWGKSGWSSMQFDKDDYPDPKAMIDELHTMDIKFMLSVWAKIGRDSDLGKQMADSGYYIGDTEWIDFFNPKAADAYCKAQRERLASLGVDAWWQDATEPENDDLDGRMVNNGTMSGNDVRNIYSYKVNENVSKSLDNPFILTRSASAGIQKFGVAVWSGDVGNDWETLRRQIVAGLGLVSTGLPWWTYDAGGFFRPADQYTNEEYQQRMIRWIQTAVFLPLMRVHGYQSNTEPWQYSKPTEEKFVEAIKLREKLLPLIYQMAEQVTKGYTMMRPLVFDFPDDPKALQQQTEYMFGPLLVNPILEQNPETWTTYLPDNKYGWIDIWTGKMYDGGQDVTLPVSADHIPVFVNAIGLMHFKDNFKD
ncbi:MAG: glycoside hydrolase family 31 protein [Prevotellaceae bacterium]|nr:glycoside hydrolase family 31 protein [Prevotellaceae bacterium]